MTPFRAQFRILAVGHNSKSKSELWFYVEPRCDASKQIILDHGGYPRQYRTTRWELSKFPNNYYDQIICVFSMSWKDLRKHFKFLDINITLLSDPDWMTNGGIMNTFSEQTIWLNVNDFKVKYSYPKYSSHGYRRLTFICDTPKRP